MKKMSARLAAVFQDNVRGRMKALGFNQTTLAEALGVTPSHVSQLLSGERRPGLDGLENMAAVLKCEPADLLRQLPAILSKAS